MSVEKRLGELMEQERGTAGLAPGPIIARARRRRGRRAAGAGAAALAVALVCGVTAVTVGSARQTGGVAGAAGAALTPSAGPVPGAAAASTPTAAPTPGTTALPLSPVRQVAAGEKVEFADGARIWVTAREKCDEYRDVSGTWGNGTGCRDVTSDNLEHDRPSIYGQGTFGRDRSLVASFYLGPQPARIVAFVGGKPTVATLVTTPGMKDWTAFYAVLPGMPWLQDGRPSSPALAAYDAEGRLLAELPGRGADGAQEKAPARL
ncbi:hypothetical protein [Streptomyces sp. CB01881]|uniref:hypothetical protein n=1 Tax=Streptomyces sp. CB01881 TaxID=2078691 RepID=UPI0011DFBEFB|nr:hypothetical protein [Streptomyces sp. CB01881]TYC73449.1 hypothetical protein EH183_15215 [Streptomyces sp. CB01881]